MEGMQFDDICIRGIATAVPTKRVYTDEFRQFYGDKEIDRFIESVGIVERFQSVPQQTASDLCFVAAKALEGKYGFSDDVDALIFASQTPDYCIPSTAFILQHRLGIKQDCLVFDINLGCTAFVTCICTICGMIKSGMIRRALLMIGDVKQQHDVSEDHSETMLYGDAGSAILMEKGIGSVRGMIRSDGSGFKKLIAPFPGSRYPVFVNGKECNEFKEIMDGSEVFLFAITKVPKLFKEFYSYFKTDSSEYNYIILHQANKLIIDKIRGKLKVDNEKIPISIDRFGNTNGASIPLTICDAFGNDDSDSNYKLIASGFGIGLSYGIVSFDICTEDVLPIIHSDDFYKEGFAL